MEDGSRYDTPRERAEIAAFRETVSFYGCNDAVTGVFYDSKSNTCHFTLIADATLEQQSKIFRAAELSISQFEWDGTIYHGYPMAAMDDILDEEILLDANDSRDDDCSDYAVVREKGEPASRRMTLDAKSDAIKHAIQAGREGEVALAAWFSEHGLAYGSICQNLETFAKIFSGAVKRPDFLLLFDSLGLIAVDAKNLKTYQSNLGDFYTLPLDDEVKKAIAFERIFRMPVWYAVKGDGQWHWISALKAVEVGRPGKSKKGKNFISISVSDFVNVATGQDLAGLYGQRMPSYNGVALFNAVAK